MEYIVKGKKLVTVSKFGTIHNGAMVIKDGKIAAVGRWDAIHEQYPSLDIADFSNYVITPSLVDCHTHLLEYAPSSLFPVTPETHFHAGKWILFNALSSGITAIGEQICGHPLCDFKIDDYREAVKNFPLDISFATTSITIGFEELAHFSAVTQSKKMQHEDLISLKLVEELAKNSDYPGENLFINATPANFTPEMVPRAGEILYSIDDLMKIVQTFHNLGKKIGCHVAGEEGIDLALTAGFDVLHHAHGITEEQMEKVAEKGVHIVATPIGGTHLKPNSPEEILKLVEKGITVSISTDAYLPPYPNVPWLQFKDHSIIGPDSLMEIAHPSMKLLKENFSENVILELLTANPATLLGKEKQFGRLEPGLDANFLIGEGIPGLEMTNTQQIKSVFFKGIKVIERK